MSGDDRLKILTAAILCSLGLMAFSFFIQYRFPVRLLSFTGLLMAAIIISRNLRSGADLRKITGMNIFNRITFLYTISGIAAGVAVAFFYRWYLDIRLFPKSFQVFAIVAALVGSTEELVFRGFLQESVKNINGPFSILFSTVSHTGYKCCLFLSPVITADINIGYLALWTFGAGIFFGTIRHQSKSLLPSLSAHALFDILVYAEFNNAPWWVW